MAKVRIIILFALSFAGCLSMVDPNRKYKEHLTSAHLVAVPRAQRPDASRAFRMTSARYRPDRIEQSIQAI